MVGDHGGQNTRFSVLFILAIFIPGGFLAYFSIRNIGSERALAEKRLLEEEERVADQVGVFLRDELQRCANAFFAAAGDVSPDLDRIALSPDVEAYVSQPFALHGNGRFLWPRCSGGEASSGASPQSPEFHAAFSGAEKAEFAGKDLGEAARLYRAARKAARHDAERAAAINGLGRVLAKNGRLKEASREYQLLLEHYDAVEDQNGVGFARYSLHQLIRLHLREPEALAPQVSAFLSRLESGEALLTSHTGSLLEEVEEWLEGNPGVASKGPVRRQIGVIRARLAFVKLNANLGELLRSNPSGASSALHLGLFEAVPGWDGGNALFVIRRDMPQGEILGFEVDLGHLRSALLEQARRITTSPATAVSIAPRGDFVTKQDASVLVRDLGPFLPQWRVSVAARDPGIISSYVSRQRWIYGTSLSLMAAAMVLGVLLVLRDLSRERRLSQLRTDFVATVTHELKTPLTSIRMFAETLQMGRAESETARRECLDVIVGETQRLSRLINTVLDFSKIERGRKEYRMSEINLSEVAESTLYTLRYSLEEQGFTLEAELTPEVRIVGDADALEQAILNLVDNAVKYSRENKSVRIGLWTADDRVFLRVADRGIGIPEEDRSRIFEKFYRSRAGDGGDAGGAGLGLTVVRHIVEAHQGDIRLESKVKEGSSFTIVLPKTREGEST